MSKIVSNYINFTIAHYIIDPILRVKDKYRKFAKNERIVFIKDYIKNKKFGHIKRRYSGDYGDRYFHAIYANFNIKNIKIIKSMYKTIIYPSILQNSSLFAYKLVKNMFNHFGKEKFIDAFEIFEHELSDLDDDETIIKNEPINYIGVSPLNYLFGNLNNRMLKFLIKNDVMSIENIEYAINNKYKSLSFANKWNYNFFQKNKMNIDNYDKKLLSISGLPKKSVEKNDINYFIINPDYIDELVEKYPDYYGVSKNSGLYEIYIRPTYKLYKLFDNMSHKFF